MKNYELSNYYLGNKWQHRGYDENDRYSGEYRVAKLFMSDGSIRWDLWQDDSVLGYDYDTEEEAKEALEQLWLEDKDELEAQHEEDDDDEKSVVDSSVNIGGDVWQFDEIEKTRWLYDLQDNEEEELSFACAADERAFLEQFKEETF